MITIDEVETLYLSRELEDILSARYSILKYGSEEDLLRRLLIAVLNKKAFGAKLVVEVVK